MVSLQVHVQWLDFILYSLLQILMSVLIMDHVPIAVSIQQEAITASVLLDISFNPTTVTVKVSIVA